MLALARHFFSWVENLSTNLLFSITAHAPLELLILGSTSAENERPGFWKCLFEKVIARKSLI